MKTTVLIGGIAALLATAACDRTEPTLRPEFGNAVRHNMALHIINPEYRASVEPSPMDGARAGLAIQNYRTGLGPEMERVATTDVGDQ